MKVVISNKKGQAKQFEVEEDKSLMDKKIGDKFDGSEIGFEGYEFQIKGGSDDSGFPMRRDVQGTERKKILVTDSLGAHIKRKGLKRRKSVRGNTISIDTSQINVYVVKEGKEDIFSEVKEGEETQATEGSETKEEKAEQKPKEEEKKEEKPKEEQKEEPVQEKKE